MDEDVRALGERDHDLRHGSGVAAEDEASALELNSPGETDEAG